jgi:hypothetical protein
MINDRTQPVAAVSPVSFYALTLSKFRFLNTGMRRNAIRTRLHACPPGEDKPAGPEWVTSRTLCKKNGYPFAVCLNN